ncbi:MAG TPA: ABC transporter substrate-binding protein [Steroidobacteraceae bacterium]|nr:ABC transporter substrate-binding protein [Steroidobacteraceae bacterium]
MQQDSEAGTWWRRRCFLRYQILFPSAFGHRGLVALAGRSAPVITLARIVAWLAVLVLLSRTTTGLGASNSPGKPGEPIQLVVGFNPYFAPAWTLAIVLHRELWKPYLPPGSRVDLSVGLRGPVMADYLRTGALHFAYVGDAAVTLAASRSDIRLIAVTMMSQDLCVLVVRADAPVFADPKAGARWLDGKRIATTAGTCQGRFTQLVVDREGIRPARIFDLGRESLESAFREGRIDAAGVPEPGASDLVVRGIARRLTSSLIYGEWDASFIATSDGLLRARPDVVNGWLAAELAAQRFLSDSRNADEVVRILAPRARLVSDRALRKALFEAYPEAQGGSPVRAVFPFAFTAEATDTVRKIHVYLRQRGLVTAGEPRKDVIVREWTERILAAQKLKSPVGVLRAVSATGAGS